LLSAQVTQYKSITDSGAFSIDPLITCLVGKNESGKSAVLEAIYRLKPLPSGHPQTFDPLRDYPRRYYARDKANVPNTKVIEATVEIEPADVSAIEATFGPGVVKAGRTTVSKTYGGTGRTWGVSVNDKAVLQHLLAQAGLDASLLGNATTGEALVEKLKGDAAAPEAVTAFIATIEGKDLHMDVLKALADRLPAFLYFDEYNTLPGRVSIKRLQEVAEDQFDPGERTALALLRLAGVESDDFTAATYEPRRAALEAASASLSDEVFEFWSQNKDLSVELDVDFVENDDDDEIEPFLEIRIKNNRHRTSLNFGERSKGFIWFFSFLAAFSEYRDSDDPLVLLLDEPGMGLHASAQTDLLRYVEERLAPTHQVIYTTHSPFMVDPTSFERARAIEDTDPAGTQVQEDVLVTGPDTLFPLQAALGYELYQTLFVGPDCLVVEGVADLVYLQVMSDHLASLKRTGLDQRWVVTPAGGMDKVPTFIALLGTKLNVVVLLEVATGGSQKVQDLVRRGVIEGNRLVPLTKYTGTTEADIEDLFDEQTYLDLVAASGAAKPTKSKLGKQPRVIKRIETAIGKEFSHYVPARYFLQNQGTLLPKLSPSELDRFEALFKDLNTLLS
jgi:predicted ATPase